MEEYFTGHAAILKRKRIVEALKTYFTLKL
jgi:hypothetical protein